MAAYSGRMAGRMGHATVLSSTPQRHHGHDQPSTHFPAMPPTGLARSHSRFSRQVAGGRHTLLGFESRSRGWFPAGGKWRRHADGPHRWRIPHVLEDAVRPTSLHSPALPTSLLHQRKTTVPADQRSTWLSRHLELIGWRPHVHAQCDMCNPPTGC